MNARATGRLLRGFAIGLLAAALCPAAQAQPTFFDGTFDNSDWTAKIIANLPDSLGTFTSLQNTGDGCPTPPSRQTVLNFDGLIRVAQLRNGATNDPASQGANFALSYSYCLRHNNAIQGQGVAYSLLVFQNNTFYIGPTDQIFDDKFEPFPLTPKNLVATDFQKVTGRGPDKPDFSCAGPPIQLGYQTGNSLSTFTPGMFGTTTSSIDNWSVSIVKPQPCCLTTMNESTLCTTDGSSDYIYSFQVTNNSTTDVFDLLFVDLPTGVTVTSNSVSFASEPGGFLAPGAKSMVKTVRIHGAHAGSLNFRFLLLDKTGSVCCTVWHALELSACDCAQVLSDQICQASINPPVFDYTFTIQDLRTAPPVSYALLTATTPGLDVTQGGAPIVPPLVFGQTATQTVELSGPAATSGSTVCFMLGVHDASLLQCCSINRCVTVPPRSQRCFFPSPHASDLDLSLNTGIDPATPDAPQPDPNWTVIVPRPAQPAQSVLQPDSDWPWAIPGTTWISRDPSAASVAGVSVIRYRRCFCIGAAAQEATLALSLWADDRAGLLLNGVPIAGPGGHYSDSAPLSVHLTGLVGKGGPFAVGTNCLTAVVHESGNTTGLDVFGSVKAVGGACTAP
jgi:hypothetical protein